MSYFWESPCQRLFENISHAPFHGDQKVSTVTKMGNRKFLVVTTVVIVNFWSLQLWQLKSFHDDKKR
jgi:hypothetical protein